MKGPSVKDPSYATKRIRLLEDGTVTDKCAPAREAPGLNPGREHV